MPTTSVVLDHILPPDAVDLGRMVLSVKDPLQAFYQPKSLPRDISHQRLEKFSEVLRLVDGSELHGFLTCAFKTAFTKQQESTAHVESATCITRQLRNSDSYFRELCRLAAARNWLERALRGNRSVYLVVGIKTLTDATVVQTGGRLRETSVNVQVPIEAAMAAAGVPLPGLGDVANPGGGSTRTRRVDVEGRFFAPGEHIYAVQYRKVKLSRFSSRNVDKSWLKEGNRWKAYVGLRGAGADGEDDGVEANLSDIQEGLLTEVDMNGKSECLEVEGEELLYFWD
ncbi:hypothetical protein DL765_009220 [Monosporascus sp. GIB2]|nr:hypothetical protein DL765_009220 [Monosporascus sp. GIB2]